MDPNNSRPYTRVIITCMSNRLSPESTMHTEPIVLETNQPGLLLVQMVTVDDDVEYFKLQIENRDHIAEFGNTIDESVEAVTERRSDKNRVRFGIRKDGVLVGMEGYTISEDGTEAEVGILLAKDATGKGYSTPALTAMTAYIARQSKRVFAEADVNNIHSIRMLERSGYTAVEETQRDWGRAAIFEFKS